MNKCHFKERELHLLQENFNFILYENGIKNSHGIYVKLVFYYLLICFFFYFLFLASVEIIFKMSKKNFLFNHFQNAWNFFSILWYKMITFNHSESLHV